MAQANGTLSRTSGESDVGVLPLKRRMGRAGVAYLGSSEIGYSLRVRRVLGAGSRSALPLRFSVIFEYGVLIP